MCVWKSLGVKQLAREAKVSAHRGGTLLDEGRLYGVERGPLCRERERGNAGAAGGAEHHSGWHHGVWRSGVKMMDYPVEN